MIINQSLIKEFLFHSELKEYCPMRAYSHLIERTHNISTLSQQKGNYFESLCIGGGYDGQVVSDLPRKKNGDKTLDQARIDMQHLRWEAMCQKMGITVMRGFNTQTKVYKRFNEDIILEANMDLFPVVIQIRGEGQYSIIDLKLTADLLSTFGMFNWNDASAMDHIQAYMYSECATDIDLALNKEMGNDIEDRLRICGWSEGIANLTPKFHYFVFDYSPRMNTKVIPVNYTPFARKELHQSVLRTADLVRRHNNNETWTDCVPSKDNCSYCGCDCPSRFVENKDMLQQEGKSNILFDNILFEEV